MAPKGRVEREDEPLDCVTYIGHSCLILQARLTDTTNVGTVTSSNPSCTIVCGSLLQASRIRLPESQNLPVLASTLHINRNSRSPLNLCSV